MYPRFLTVLSVLAFVGCKGPPPDGKLLSLERTVCYGPCPVYSITLYDDGRVAYRAVSSVKSIGEAKGRVEVSTIATLHQELRRSGLMSLRDHCCDCYDVTDHPSVKITYDFGVGERGVVDHYHGCRATPAWLGRLEDRIDEVLHVEQFIGTRSERFKLFHSR